MKCIQINDVVKDVNGILGIVVEIDNEEYYKYGILFMNVDEDSEIWYCNQDDIEIETNLYKIDIFNMWYEEYNKLYIPYQNALKKANNIEEEIKTMELRPLNDTLYKLYKKYSTKMEGLI